MNAINSSYIGGIIMKKIAAILASAVILLSLTACGENENTSKTESRNSQQGESTGQSVTPDTPNTSDTSATGADGFVYNFDSNLNGMVITDYIGESPEVIVPDTIDGKPVVKVDVARCENPFAKIFIPQSVTDLGDDFFTGCFSLAEITVAEGNSEFLSIDGILYGDDGKTLLNCPCAKVGDIVIPDGVTEIDGSAFAECKSITSVTFPEGLTKIGPSAFHYCQGIKSITIPDSVTKLGYAAFMGCLGMESVTIGNGITVLESQTFYRCIALKSVTIPDSVTAIYNEAFARCENLTDVVIGSGVASIGDKAFEDCANLGDITIPDSVTELIGLDVFRGCKNISAAYKGTTYTYNNIYDLYHAVNG